MIKSKPRRQRSGELASREPEWDGFTNTLDEATARALQYALQGGDFFGPPAGGGAPDVELPADEVPQTTSSATKRPGGLFGTRDAPGQTSGGGGPSLAVQETEAWLGNPGPLLQKPAPTGGLKGVRRLARQAPGEDLDPSGLVTEAARLSQNLSTTVGTEPMPPTAVPFQLPATPTASGGVPELSHKELGREIKARHDRERMGNYRAPTFRMPTPMTAPTPEPVVAPQPGVEQAPSTVTNLPPAEMSRMRPNVRAPYEPGRLKAKLRKPLDVSGMGTTGQYDFTKPAVWNEDFTGETIQETFAAASMLKGMLFLPATAENQQVWDNARNQLTLNIARGLTEVAFTVTPGARVVSMAVKGRNLVASAKAFRQGNRNLALGQGVVNEVMSSMSKDMADQFESVLTVAKLTCRTLKLKQAKYVAAAEGLMGRVNRERHDRESPAPQNG